MNDLVERMRTILLEETSEWKDASDEDVIEATLFILQNVCSTPMMLFEMYSD